MLNTKLNEKKEKVEAKFTELEKRKQLKEEQEALYRKNMD